MSPSPRHDRAPAVEGNRGDGRKEYQPHQADASRVARSRFSRRLDDLLDEMYPRQVLHHSEQWERSVANQLVRRGFDPAYLERRYGLTRKAAA